MKLQIYIIFVTFIFCINIWQCSQSDPANSLAIIENENITTSDFLERYERFLISTGVKDSPVARDQILNHMINEILLANFDDNKDIINSVEFENAKDAIYKELLLAYYKETEIYAKIEITENELREAFKKVNQQVSARHIYARTLQEANNYYDQLNNGTSFDKLASIAFEDETLSQNGGYLGYFTWGDMDPAFEEAAYSLKIGEISKPVKTEYGYSIIKVEDRFQNPILTESEFSRKKKSLRRLLGISKVKKQEKKYIEDLLQELQIEIDEEALTKLINYIKLRRIKPGEKNNTNENTVLVNSKNTEMTIAEGFENIQKLATSNRKRINSEKTLKAALKGIVLQKALVKDAEAKNYQESAEFKKVYDQWIFGELIRMKKEYLEKSFTIPDSQIINYYENHKNKMFTDEKINVQEILLTSKIDADKVNQLIQQGEDFAHLAAKYSIRKWAAPKGGLLGLLPKYRYKYLGDIIDDIPLNNVIGPMQVGEYFVIARVVEREEARQKTLEEARQEIEDIIRDETKRQHFTDYINTLRNKNTVEVNEKQLMAIQLPG